MRNPRCLSVPAIAFAILVALAAPAMGDELQEVSKLVAAGRLIEAGNRADAYLEKMPKDAQMRFLKGVVLSQRGERDAAVVVFTRLTQDYPELPEPYNNLAVIHAAEGQYDDARVDLETAIRVAPNNATAYENLGDIYAALAARSYRDARRYDPRNASALRKLDAVRGMLTAAAPAAPATPVAPVAIDGSTASTASTLAANAARSQRNVGLPAPAGFPSITAGVTAEPPEAIVPAGANGSADGVNVVGIETPSSPDRTATATLAGATTDIAAANRVERSGETPEPVAQITTVVQRWAASHALTTSDLSVRVNGDAATARFRAADTRAPSPAPAYRLLTLHRDGGTWTVTDEGPSS